MAQEFTTIDEYIASFPDDVQQVLQRIRETIQHCVPDTAETISYKIPAITLEGRSLVYFAGWKKHVSLYPVPETDVALEKELRPHIAGKGTLKFPLDQPVPYELIGRVAKLLAEQRS